MNKKFKTILGIFLFMTFLGIAVFAYYTLSDDYKPNNEISIEDSDSQQVDEGYGEPEEKFRAPDFTVFDSEGDEVHFTDYVGKPMVINFWASWCPPCKAEMPHFNKVYNELEDEVFFMMIDLVDGQRETQESGRKYIEEMGFAFPVFFDNNQNAASVYGIMSIPTTVFIDSDGYLITGVQGTIDEETLLQGIDLIK